MKPTLCLLLLLGLLLASPCWAAEPAAIVEDVTAKNAGVGFMDYLEPGRVIRLGASETLVLGYLRSCWRETITGGRTTVGNEQSRVEGGTVRRERVECDGGRMRLAKSQAGKSGVTVFRLPKDDQGNVLPMPDLAIYGLSPVVSLKGGGRAVIERLDKRGERLEIEIKGNHADLASSKQELIPGGLYRIRSGKRSIVFTVDGFAMPGKGPIVSRWICFCK